MQEVFGGVLTSDVPCGECGEASSTRDPLPDLSLELRARPPPAPPHPLQAGHFSPSGHCSVRDLQCHVDPNVAPVACL